VAARSWAATEEVNRRLQEVAARYEAQLAEQRRLVARWRVFSPALLAQEVLLDAAGTGDARYQDFRAQVVAFAEEWKRFFVPRVMAGTAIASAELAAVPEFRYVEDAAGARARRLALPLLALAALTLAVAALGFGRLSRYPVVG
jgi:ABC-2 type transport system permease protein